MKGAEKLELVGFLPKVGETARLVTHCGNTAMLYTGYHYRDVKVIKVNRVTLKVLTTMNEIVTLKLLHRKAMIWGTSTTGDHRGFYTKYLYPEGTPVPDNYCGEPALNLT